MKKYLLLSLILIAAACGDEGFTSRQPNPSIPGSGSNSPLTRPCPDINAWMMKALSSTNNPPGYWNDIEVFYALKPLRVTTLYGAIGGTATLSIKNTGNVTFVYRNSPSDPWTSLAVGATNTFTKPINTVACGITPTQQTTFSVRAKISSCPIIVFGGIWKFKAEVKLVSVDNFNTVATCQQINDAGEICNTPLNGFTISSQASDGCTVAP